MLQWLWSFSLSSVTSLITIAVYSFLVPILIFLMLKDHTKMIQWIESKVVSEHMSQLYAISAKITAAINRYLYGKVIEMLAVASVTYIAFAIFGLKYALLLAILSGISVIIPYVGAIAVTIPIALIGLSQWGMVPLFWYVFGAHIIIQILDGNVLVPILFSEAVNLHPLAILLSVIVFGGFWGIWGVFFAIPLATIIQVLIKNWPINNQS